MKLKNSFKGWLGELAIKITASIVLPKSKYHKFNNVTLTTENGTTQIDHIIVSQYGIFVIETKYMNGWIFGSEHQKYWTQKLFNKTFKFQNPLHQNYLHIKTLENLLPTVPQSVFHSIIAMCGEHTIKTKMPKNVVRCIQFPQYIKKFKEIMLTQGEINKVTEQIKKHRLPATRETHKNHIEHLKQRFNDKDK